MNTSVGKSGMFDKYLAPYVKELEEVLKSDLSANSKIFVVKGAMNNLSKLLFKSINPVTVGKGGLSGRQVVQTRRGNYALSITVDMGLCQCRQYYDGLKGFYCYNVLTDKIFKVRDELIKSRVEGTGNQKLSASSVKVWTCDAEEISLYQFEEEVYGRG